MCLYHTLPFRCFVLLSSISQYFFLFRPSLLLIFCISLAYSYCTATNKIVSYSHTRLSPPFISSLYLSFPFQLNAFPHVGLHMNVVLHLQMFYFRIEYHIRDTHQEHPIPQGGTGGFGLPDAKHTVTHVRNQHHAPLYPVLSTAVKWRRRSIQ